MRTVKQSRLLVAAVGVVGMVAAMLVGAQAASAEAPSLPGCLVSNGAGNYTVSAGAPCVVPPITVPGSITVERGAILAMPAGGTVEGNIAATNALSIYLLGVTVNGNVSSIGGGPGRLCQSVQSATPPGFSGRDLVLKGDTITGSLTLKNWSGCWLGVLRSTIGGNMSIKGNYANPNNIEFDGTRQGLDSTEIVANTIGGNLRVVGNTPKAQYGDAYVDQSSVNKVSGRVSGEARSITKPMKGTFPAPANGLKAVNVKPGEAYVTYFPQATGSGRVEFYMIAAQNQTDPNAAPIVVTTRSNGVWIKGLTDGDVYTITESTTSTVGTSAPSTPVTLTTNW